MLGVDASGCVREKGKRGEGGLHRQGMRDAGRKAGWRRHHEGGGAGWGDARAERGEVVGPVGKGRGGGWACCGGGGFQ